MRISLDYYQILGVSFDATPEQIQQSYEDRLQQLPKQQYSSAAIASRKKLLLEAHSILLNPTRRQEHDQYLFPDLDPSADESTGTPLSHQGTDKGVDIETNFLAGALILLIEFGEFNSVIELGLSHLNRSIDLEKIPDEVGPMDDDVALAVAIANLELGREYWHQEEHEQAGQCLQAGLKILREEGKFLNIQAEIETDLSKLRPYRVLDLLALDESDPERAEGLSLLQDMLDERGGMEGHGDDQSGLSVNDFLVFMQQLRDNLTVEEQFNLFRAESMRPSSVATYLSVYAHVARGISGYDPSLISQAKSLLASLADRQDLSLEQGMCSLLLGQPDAAAHCVQQSQDEEAIAFITDYSEGAPDIVPGLYLYTEQWLQQEVYPYFRDLNAQTVSLENYFNDEDVQRQLSDLEPDLPNVDSTWDTNDVDAKWEQWLHETTQTSGDEDLPQNPSALSAASPENEADDAIADLATKAPTNWFSALTSSKSKSQHNNEAVVNSEPTDFQTDFQWATDNLTASDEIQPVVHSAPTSASAAPSQPPQKRSTSPKEAHRRQSLSSRKSTGLDVQSQATSATTNSSRAKKPIWVFWGASFLLGISVVWGALAIGRLFQTGGTNTSTGTDPVNSGLTAPVNDSNSTRTSSSNPTESKELDATAPPRNGELTKEAALEVVRAWQKVKAEALGKAHQIDPLGQILTEPALSRWEYSADISKEEGQYTTYNLKNIEILNVTVESPTAALVRAMIIESRDQYDAGVSEPFASIPEDQYQVDYSLTLLDGKWRIKEMKLLDQ